MKSNRSTELPRILRRRATEAETRLWFRLRNRQVGGYKFRRQQAIGPYIVDFFCQEALLIVEVDGSQHYEPQSVVQDQQRTACLESLGLRVIRFNNREVLIETAAVLDVILTVLTEPPSP